MKLYYITHTRMPTGRAHGFTIAKSCESFGQIGMDVVFVTPALKSNATGDLFDIYKISRTFAVRYLPVVDAVRFSGSRAAFMIRIMSFYMSVACFMSFRSRRDVIVYTRDASIVLLLTVLGFRSVFECHMIPQNRERFFRICRRARIITISNALRDAFITEGFSAGKILVAPSGVDLSTFAIDASREVARQVLSLPADARIATYTGNFTTMGADKGIADIITALKELPQILFVAAGGGEADIEHYRNLAREQHVDQQVRLSGQAPQTTLALYQRAADILLMPFPDTPHYRNHMSPVKMFEYMASGRPIVASDLPTIREVLNEANAVIIPPGDPHALAGAVDALLDDPARAEALSHKARSDVVEYTWQSRAERIRGFITTA